MRGEDEEDCSGKAFTAVLEMIVRYIEYGAAFISAPVQFDKAGSAGTLPSMSGKDLAGLHSMA